MHMPLSLRKDLLIFLPICLILIVGKNNIDRIAAKANKKNSQLIMNPYESGFHRDSLKLYNFGFANAIAGLIWIELLQKASHEPVTTKEVSWEFTLLDGLTVLNPEFDRAYSFGAPFLSVFRRDLLGGKIFLKKWVTRRPNYWWAYYAMGFHYFSELKDYEEAAKAIFKAASLERAPSWLPALGIRLLSESGSLMHALQVSLNLMQEMTDEEGRERLSMRIRNLNFRLQEIHWNDALKFYHQKYKRFPKGFGELRLLVSPPQRKLASFIPSQGISKETESLLLEEFPFDYDKKQNKVVLTKKKKELGLEEVIGIHRPK